MAKRGTACGSSSMASMGDSEMKNCIRAAVIGVITAFMVTAAFAEDPGAHIYKYKCAMCHGDDGLASTPTAKAMKTPPFDSKVSDAERIAITKNGKDKMPAYAAKLTGAEIKDVVAYIRTLEKK